jgi:hypothetical protein
MTRPEDARGLRLVGHSLLNGFGDGMQVLREGDALYVGHFGPSGMGTSILDVSDPARPAVVRQWRAPPGTHTHKVQVAEGLLLINHERFRGGKGHSAGMAVYSLADPFDPARIGFFEPGGLGVHRMVWTGGRYAYVSATPEGFEDRIWLVVDLIDPERPAEAGRWWWPGQWTGGGEVPEWPPGRRYAAHHALVRDDRAYLGYGDAGMVILDIADVAEPKLVSSVSWTPGGDTHTCLPLPGEDLVVVTDESVKDRCQEDTHLIHVVDVSDVTEPRVMSTCPVPDGDFCDRGLRFGPHNLHENRPGSHVSAKLVFATYFNAGVRVYDLEDPLVPAEIAHWVPETPAGQEDVQINDLFVDASGLVYATDRVLGGVYVLAPEDDLAARMDAARSAP